MAAARNKMAATTNIIFFTLLLFLEVALGTINVLWVNDARNDVANETLGALLGNLKSRSMDKAEINRLDQLQAHKDEPGKTVEEVCTLLDDMTQAGATPDLILDTTLAGKSSDVLKSLAFTQGVPMVSMTYGNEDDLGEWSGLTPAQQQYLIQIQPPGDTLLRGIRQLVIDQNITNAAILFDQNFVMDYRYRSLLLNVPCRHLINPMKTSPMEMKQQLQMMSDIDLNNIFLVGSLGMVQKYLDVANSQKMYGNKYSWYVVSKDSTKNMKCNCNELSVMTVQPEPLMTDKVSNVKRTNDLKMGADIDIAFYYDTAMIAAVAMEELKAMPTWQPLDLQPCGSNDGSIPPPERSIALRDKFNMVGPGLYSYGALKASKNGMDAMAFAIDVNMNQYKQKSLVKVEDVGKLMTSSADDTIDYKNGKMAAFAATTVYKITTVIQPPFVMKSVDKSGKTVFTGYCIDLINELKQLMDFDYELSEAPDGQYGTMNESMVWNGMVKELADKNADIALGALSVMAERENVVDFTVPYYDLVGITILMKKPKVATSLFRFLTVLEDSVWGCILLAYFITSVLMWAFDRLSPYSYQNNMEKYKDDDEKRYFNVKECFWFCMTSLTPQGGGEAPKNLSGRLVAATWWLFGFIIIASYTANLAAFLTVSRLETPVESLEDLSKQYKIQYSPMNGSATMTYFERMAYIEEKFYEIWKDMSLNDSMSDLERAKLAVWDYPVSDKYTKMWQSMKEAGLPMTFDEALERVRKSPTSSEGYAFLGDATDIRYQVLTNCDLQMVGEEFSRKPYALAVQQGSPLKDQFNDAILKLLNQRKLETLKERWWNQNPNKKVCDDDDDSGGGISIYNIGGVFIVIFVGIGLAIVTLIFEYWYYKYKKPSSVDSAPAAKQLQVKQAKMGQGAKGEYETEYRSGASNIAPVGNPW